MNRDRQTDRDRHRHTDRHTDKTRNSQIVTLILPMKILNISSKGTAEAVDEEFQQSQKWDFNRIWVSCFNLPDHMFFSSNKSALTRRIMKANEKRSHRLLGFPHY